MYLCAEALRDDIRGYLPELLPRFAALIAEAERRVMHPTRPLLEPAVTLIQSQKICQLGACAEALRDDIRGYLPDLLPRFAALIAEAERSGNYSPVEPALRALEALGLALEEHLPLVLPALVRLICPGEPQFWSLDAYTKPLNALGL